MASTKVVKATYVLQGLVMLLFPAAAVLEGIRARWRTAYTVLLVILAAALLYDLPAMITRYNVFAFWLPG
jgi:hypothetical protein